MLRTDQVKDNTAGLIHEPFQSSSNVNFTVHTQQLYSSFQLVVLTVGSSVFLPWKDKSHRRQQAGTLWEVSDHHEGTKQTVLHWAHFSWLSFFPSRSRCYATLVFERNNKQKRIGRDSNKDGHIHACALTPQLTTHTQHHHLLLYWVSPSYYSRLHTKRWKEKSL